MICYPMLTMYFFFHQFVDPHICEIEVDWLLRGLFNTVWDLIPLGTVLVLHSTSYQEETKIEEADQEKYVNLMDSRR